MFFDPNNVQCTDLCNSLISAVLDANIPVDEKVKILSKAMFDSPNPVSTQDLANLKAAVYDHEVHFLRGCTDDDCCADDVTS